MMWLVPYKAFGTAREVLSVIRFESPGLETYGSPQALSLKMVPLCT